VAKPKHTGVLQNSLYFLVQADREAQSIQVSQKRESGKPETLYSIILASAALEAFINERVEMAVQLCEAASQPTPVIVFSHVMTDAEESKASLRAKYELARWVLCGQAYDRGGLLYQDFVLLTDLRNSIVHLKPWPAVIERLTGKGLLAHTKHAEVTKLIKSYSGGWTVQIQTKEMAIWASQTAVKFIADLLDSASNNMLVRPLMPTTAEVFRFLLKLAVALREAEL
jgi:hypothetical protein